MTANRDVDAPADAIDLAALARSHLTPVLGRYFERGWSHGEGHRLYDTAGKAYLDFANGIAVSALGHHHPAVTAAIHEQVDRLIVPTMAIGYAEPSIRLANELAATFPEPLAFDYEGVCAYESTFSYTGPEISASELVS